MEDINAPPNIEKVYQAICTLYQNSDPKEKEEAGRWLVEFQKSIYSWTISDELLQQNRDLNSSYFAAQTMRNKIQNSFYELPVSSHESLRNSLLNRISQVNATTDTLVLRQLSLAIADLALLMSSWHDPIDTTLELIVTQPQTVHAVIEVLTYIPEEIDSRILRLGANRRAEVLRMLNGKSPKVMEFLTLCLNRVEGGNHTELLYNILGCFKAWVRAGTVTLKHFVENIIAQHVFEMLTKNATPNSLHDRAADCITAMLSIVEHTEHRGNLDETVLMHIFNGVVLLESAYMTAVAHEDLEQMINYCRIFTVLCEAFLPEMLSSKDVPHYSIKGLDLLLICVGHFDYELAEITFNVWYRLSEELFQQNNERLTAHFKPYIERLLMALYRHAQMEADHEGLIVEGENFYDFRLKVSELIKDVAFIVGSNNCFKQMYVMLQEPGNTWEATEAALFVMQNVAKNIIPDENEVIPKVVEAILQQPESTHIAVRYTSILLLGELCDWIEGHSESLDMVLNFLLYALQQRNGLANAASISLTSICAACRQQMTQHVSGLIEIVRNLENFNISNELAIGVLKGISLTLSRLPHEQLMPALCEIITLLLAPLAHLVDNAQATLETIQRGEATDPVYWIDRVCAVIRHTNPDVKDGEVHPTLKILNDAWPLLSRTMDKYQTESRVMERVCRLIRYGLRMVRKQSSGLVQPLINQMIVLYGLHHHSCFLYLGSILVDEFCRVPECLPVLFEMLRAFIEPTFSLLQLENGLRNNPDTVDDFFRLCSRFVECCPLPFLRSALVPPIFQCALLACTLDHREANTSVMKFFVNLLKWGRSSNVRVPECRPLVKEFIQQHGEALIVNLIHASVFNLHTYMLTDVAEVLIEIRTVMDLDQFKSCLMVAVNNLPKNNMGGSLTATQEQLDDFCLTLIRGDTIRNIATALKNFARLFR